MRIGAAFFFVFQWSVPAQVKSLPYLPTFCNACARQTVHCHPFFLHRDSAVKNWCCEWLQWVCKCITITGKIWQNCNLQGYFLQLCEICSCAAMLNLQVFDEVLRVGMLATATSRSLLRDILSAFAEVTSILFPASVMLLGMQGDTVIVSLHLTTTSNFNSIVATRVHVLAMPAAHVQWPEDIAPGELMMAQGLGGMSFGCCECMACRQDRGRQRTTFYNRVKSFAKFCFIHRAVKVTYTKW